MRSVRIFIERDRVFLQSGVRQTLLGLRLMPMARLVWLVRLVLALWLV